MTCTTIFAFVVTKFFCNENMALVTDCTYLFINIFCNSSLTLQSKTIQLFGIWSRTSTIYCHWKTVRDMYFSVTMERTILDKATKEVKLAGEIVWTIRREEEDLPC